MNSSEDKQGGENQKALRLTCDELAAQFETGGAPAQITMIDSLLIATALRQYAVSSCAAQEQKMIDCAPCLGAGRGGLNCETCGGIVAPRGYFDAPPKGAPVPESEAHKEQL